jgi:hypothetical protein
MTYCIVIQHERLAIGGVASWFDYLAPFPSALDLNVESFLPLPHITTQSGISRNAAKSNEYNYPKIKFAPMC